MTNDMKNVPELRFPEFDGGWEEKKLKDITELLKDGTHGTHKDAENGPWLLSAKNLKNNKINITSEDRKIPESEFDKIYKNYTLKKGDILLSIVGTIGRTALVNNPNKIAFQRSVAILRINKYHFNKYYLYLFETQSFYKKLLRNQVVSAQPGLYLGDLGKFYLAFPNNIKEQQKIGDFFSKLDRQIELEEQKLEKLEEQKKGYMQKIFSQQLRFKDENGNDYPEWEEDFLYNIFSSYKGKGLSKDKISNEGKHNCILYGEIYTTYTEKIENIVSKTDYNEGFLSQENDLIFPSSTTTNAWDLATFVALKQKNVLLGGDISVLRSKRYEVSSLFYAYYLSNYLPIRREIAKYAQGITIVHLSFKSFNKIKVKIPSIKEQNVITNFIDHLNQNQTLIQRKINVLKQRKQGFLQKMFV